MVIGQCGCNETMVEQVNIKIQENQIMTSFIFELNFNQTDSDGSGNSAAQGGPRGRGEARQAGDNRTSGKGNT